MALIRFPQHLDIIENIILCSLEKKRALRNLRLTCRPIKEFIDKLTQSLYTLHTHRQMRRLALTPWRRSFILFGGPRRDAVLVMEAYTPNGLLNPRAMRLYKSPTLPLAYFNRSVYRAHPFLVLPTLTQPCEVGWMDFYMDTPLGKLASMVATTNTLGDVWVIAGMEGWNELVTVRPPRGSTTRPFEDHFARAVDNRYRKALRGTLLGHVPDWLPSSTPKLDKVSRGSLIITVGPKLAQTVEDASRALHG